MKLGGEKIFTGSERVVRLDKKVKRKRCMRRGGCHVADGGEGGEGFGGKEISSPRHRHINPP